MKSVWDACTEAGVAIPDAVVNFFNGETPDEAGVEIDEKDLIKCGALRQWSDEHRSGFELDVAKLPEGLRLVRFYNSW